MNKLPCKSVALIPTDSGNIICELDVPFVPTPLEVVNQMLSIANLHKNDTLYDLGCGDGRIVIAAAKKYGIGCVGVDLDPRRIEDCRQNAMKSSVDGKVNFIQKNFFDVDISNATIVSLYLLSNVNVRLRSKLFNELKPGSRIISHDFSMDKWLADKRVYTDNHTLFMWTIPANFSGAWRWKTVLSSTTLKFSIQIKQQFQKGSVTVISPENVFVKSVSIYGVKIELKFDLLVNDRTTPLQLIGTLNKDCIEGEYRTPAISTGSWCAIRDELSTASIV